MIASSNAVCHLLSAAKRTWALQLQCRYLRSKCTLTESIVRSQPAASCQLRILVARVLGWITALRPLHHSRSTPYEMIFGYFAIDRHTQTAQHTHTCRCVHVFATSTLNGQAWNMLAIEVECRNNVIINKLDEVKWPFDPPIGFCTAQTRSTAAAAAAARNCESWWGVCCVCTFMIASVHRNAKWTSLFVSVVHKE